MKNRNLIITLIIVLGILSVSLILFMVSMLQGKFRFYGFSFSQTVSKQLVFDQVYDDDFELLDIVVNTGDIFIKESSDPQIHLLIYSDSEDVEVTDLNHQLQIHLNEKDCHFFCFERKISKVEIFLPSEYAHLIQIENHYGDVEIGKFLDATIEVTEKCGDISILGGKKVTVQNEYGDIRVDQVEDAKIRESAGDVVIGTVQNVTVENNYGDVRIQKVLNTLDIREDCGNVEIGEVILGKDSSITNSYGDIEIGFTNEIYINATTSLGDVDINRNYQKSDVTLNIRNSCGDIQINN